MACVRSVATIRLRGGCVSRLEALKRRLSTSPKPEPVADSQQTADLSDNECDELERSQELQQLRQQLSEMTSQRDKLYWEVMRLQDKPLVQLNVEVVEPMQTLYETARNVTERTVRYELNDRIERLVTEKNELRNQVESLTRKLQRQQVQLDHYNEVYYTGAAQQVISAVEEPEQDPRIQQLQTKLELSQAHTAMLQDSVDELQIELEEHRGW